MIKEALPSPVEMPIELWINEEKNVTFMCSPCDLEDLAIGHLLTRGMVNDISIIQDIEIKKDTYQIFVTTSQPVFTKLYTVPEFVLSGTSCVSEFSDNIYKIPRIENDYSVGMDKIVNAARILSETAPMHNTTGGVHGSIIYTGNKYYLREDIGRHCAVDKAIGAAIKDNADLSHSFICTTGRVSLDMLLKSAAVGIPLIASLKYPSDMGIKLAQHYNIAIVSGALSQSPITYAYEKRVMTPRHELKSYPVDLVYSQ